MSTNKDDTKEYRYTIAGEVQGVGYRVFVRHTAGQLGIAGTVENKHDGSVVVTAQGKEEALKALEHKLRHGIHHARIKDIRVQSQEPTQKLVGFSIIHGTH